MDPVEKKNRANDAELSTTRRSGDLKLQGEADPVAIPVAAGESNPYESRRFDESNGF
ncbi:hypothetical protein YC2023_101882 [Brassica napus]